MESYDHLKRQITKNLAESYGCYSDEYLTYVEPTLQHVAKEMCRFVKNTRGVRVVDLATGTGLIARALAKNGLDHRFGHSGLRNILKPLQIPKAQRLSLL